MASDVNQLSTIDNDKCSTKLKIIPKNLRSNSWKNYLNVSGKANVLSEFDELYNLEEQNEIRECCQNVIDNLGITSDNNLTLVCDLEAVITFFCKSKNISFYAENGWIEILEILSPLELNRSDLYNTFYAFLSKYIPNECYKNGKPFHFFRLLLLYHDPELCTFLDSKKISPDMYAQAWFRSLFSGCCNIDTIQIMWDVYLQNSDSFLIFFLALVLLVNAKDQILGMENDTNESIIEILKKLPDALEPEDVEDFCSLAQYYSSKTPQTFRLDYQIPLFGSATVIHHQEEFSNVSQTLCLPIEISELLHENQCSKENDNDTIRYFLVDCRPAEQYNAGHLPVAFHLDAQLMLHNPSEFTTAVAALFSAQSQSLAAASVASGDHLCFIGSGIQDEDSYLYMVVSHFLQKNVRYVSIAKGGFKSLHDVLKHSLNELLSSHIVEMCYECKLLQKHVQTSSSSSFNFLNDIKKESEQASNLLNKWSSVLQNKSSVIKNKALKYIKNEQQEHKHHVSSESIGKRYRNMANVFTIGDDEDDGYHPNHNNTPEEYQEQIHLDSWMKKQSEIVNKFKCEHISISEKKLYESLIVITSSFLFILRLSKKDKRLATIIAKKPLTSIVKITSNKKQQELITLKYGIHKENDILINGYDKFFIPDASQATKVIKIAVMNLLDSIDVS